MPSYELFLPLLKVDLDQRLVHGTVTAEQPDRAGEICDYETTKPHFEAWSKEASDATNGRSLGAVRAMHGRVAAGKLTDITFDDDNKRILVAAKIVDDDEWTKVLEGIYTGFSQGGRYIARWPDADTGLTRYTADPIEISLVDVPCLPGATFDVIKDGAVEKRAFVSHDRAKDEPPPHADIEREAVDLSPNKGTNAVGKKMQKAARALKFAARKLERLVDDNGELRKSLADLRPELAALSKRLAELEAKPMPARAALRAIPRGLDASSDANGGASLDSAVKRLAALTPEERALALTKLSLANPLTQRF